MQRQNYMITAEEVAESMGISLGYTLSQPASQSSSHAALCCLRAQGTKNQAP